MAWYIIVGPVVKRIFEHFLKKKKKKFAAEVTSIIDSFPFLRSISRFSGHTFKPLKGVNNMVQFLSAIIFLSLSADEEERLLREQMDQQLVQAVLRRLSALK